MNMQKAPIYADPKVIATMPRDAVLVKSAAHIAYALRLMFGGRKSMHPLEYREPSFEYFVYMRAEPGPNMTTDLVIIGDSPNQFTSKRGIKTYDRFNKRVTDAVRAAFDGMVDTGNAMSPNGDVFSDVDIDGRVK